MYKENHINLANVWHTEISYETMIHEVEESLPLLHEINGFYLLCVLWRRTSIHALSRQKVKTIFESTVAILSWACLRSFLLLWQNTMRKAAYKGKRLNVFLVSDGYSLWGWCLGVWWGQLWAHMLFICKRHRENIAGYGSSLFINYFFFFKL